MKRILKKIFDMGVNERTRQEWVRKALNSLASGTRLLDAGAGEQQYRKYCGHLDYVAQDFGQYDGSGDQSGLQTGKWDYSGIDIVSDITRIPQPDCSFDAILCTEVFEHIPDPLAALKEFRRLLKPSGVLILTAPFASLVHFAPYYFCNGFSRYWYDRHLSEMGFEVREIVPNGDWYDFLSQEIWRFPSVVAQRSKLLAVVAAPFALLMLSVVRLCAAFVDRSHTQDIAVLGYHCIACRCS